MLGVKISRNVGRKDLRTGKAYFCLKARHVRTEFEAVRHTLSLTRDQPNVEHGQSDGQVTLHSLHGIDARNQSVQIVGWLSVDDLFKTKHHQLFNN
jgi:hypothetical protein